MALADMPLRGLFKRQQKQVETIIDQLVRMTSEISGSRYQTFNTRADFLASAGDFRFAWLNNNIGTDGLASFWIRADSTSIPANSTDVQTVGSYRFFSVYARENL